MNASPSFRKPYDDQANGAAADSRRTSSTSRRTCTKGRLLRCEVVTLTTWVSGVEKYRRTAARSIDARGLVSNAVPRSAFSAAIELLTYIVAEPSSDR